MEELPIVLVLCAMNILLVMVVNRLEQITEAILKTK